MPNRWLNGAKFLNNNVVCLYVKLSFIDTHEVLISEHQFGGGPFVVKNLVTRLPRYFDVEYYPRMLTVLRIKNEKQREAVFSALDKVKQYGITVPDKVFRFLNEMRLNKRPKEIIEGYLEAVTAEADRSDYYLDLHYWIQNIEHAFAFLPYREFVFGDVYAFSKRSGNKALVMLMGLGDQHSRFLGNIPLKYLKSVGIRWSNPIDLMRWEGYEISTRLYARNLRNDMFVGVLSLSEGALTNIGLYNCKKCRVPNPSLAFDAKLLKFRNSFKSNYIMFFARLVSNKGILELPYIYKLILRHVDVNLVIAGRFFESRTEYAFKKMLKDLGIDHKVKILGYLPADELYKTIAQAKLLLYPSHSDSFSLAILESLAAGTPVVAYDIPGPRSVFSGLPAVKFVKEFDKRSMAKEAVKILRLSEKEYYDLTNDKRVLEFLKAHSSWDNAARAVAEKITIVMEMF